MKCSACARGAHLSCEPVPDADREMVFTDCSCFCDPEAAGRTEHVRVLLAEANAAHAAGNDMACVEMLRRALTLLAPRKPVRKLALVRVRPSKQVEQEIPGWMERRR